MPKKKAIYLGSDHAGWHLKQEVKRYLQRVGVPYIDVGNLKYDKTDDYPDFAKEAAKRVARNKTKGILFCHNGVGVCIVANKIKGIRAVNACSTTVAKESRLHNDANILCLGGEHISVSQAKAIIRVWLTTRASQAERHQRRLKKISKIEREK